uniref:Secreted protein n=1 Tax=Rhipicephalus appendiculatus TaxID=34631 RepID=A0A131Y9B5_RHIAP
MRAVAMFVARGGVALLAVFLQNESWLCKVVCFVHNEEDTTSSERPSRGAVCGRSVRAHFSFGPCVLNHLTPREASHVGSDAESPHMSRAQRGIRPEIGLQAAAPSPR